MIHKAALFMRTARHLKWRQIYFRLYYRARSGFRSLRGFRYPLSLERESIPLRFPYFLSNRQSYRFGNEFTFLNVSKRFDRGIDWRFGGNGRLWSYNLNYFDFLNQEEMGREKGLELMFDFIDNIATNRTGMEPYPLSIRTINWIKFLTRYGVRSGAMDGSLYAQALVLFNNLEYHLMGNHLLENGFALLFAGLYFNDPTLYTRARGIIMTELDEQIMGDGAHFELSPMYHQIILFRLLDAINLLQHNTSLEQEMLGLLRGKATLMLGWLDRVTFKNGDIPLLNDSACSIAPDTGQLNAYAARIGVKASSGRLGESGYRKVESPGYEMVIDIGNIGPDYIPGHAHNDIFSFVLNTGGKPLIVDTGVSTYEPSPMRSYQRSTAAHNTVTVGGEEQSEMWGSFRVGRRAHVLNVGERENFIQASHNGYERLGALHTRSFEFWSDRIIINDSVGPAENHWCNAYLHFHHEARVSTEENSITANGIKIWFRGSRSIALKYYDYAPEFNMTVSAPVAVISFHKNLKTEIFVEDPFHN